MPERARSVVFTALELETDAVLEHLHDQSFVRADSLVWRRGHFDDGVGWDVHVVQTGPENAAASPVIAAALSVLKPAIALFVGIAGGIAERGAGALDVVVPETVEYLHAGKADASFVERHRQRHASMYMLSASRAVARDGRWLKRLGDEPDPVPQVHFDPLVSGEQVIKSTTSPAYESALQINDKAIAVDMEGSGFYNAANLHDSLQRALVRCISDLIDDKSADTDSARQPEAARRAAAFAFELLATTPEDLIDRHDLASPLRPWGDEAAASPVDEHEDAAAPRDTATNEAVRQSVTELFDLLDADDWARWTAGLFWSQTPYIADAFADHLRDAVTWLTGWVAIPNADRYADALENLRAVLVDFETVFFAHASLEISGQVYRTDAFYRDYSLPITQRTKLLEEFQQHVALVKNLGAEATRALNLVSDRVRVHHDQMFGVGGATAGIYQDEDFVVVRYTEDEQQLPVPYPGLAGFAKVLAGRDGVFPATPPSAEWPDELARQLPEAIADEDLAAATSLAYRLAAALAADLPDGWSVTVASGHERVFEVRFRVVTVRWHFANGVDISHPTPHLARAYLSPRGPDERRESLVGAPQNAARGEVMLPGGSRLMDSLSPVELTRFAREAASLVGIVVGDESSESGTPA